MTDHEKLLVAALSAAADADLDGRRLTAPAVMSMLYHLAEEHRRPLGVWPRPVTA